MSDRESRPWVIFALIAANLAGFAYELARGVDAMSPTVAQLLAIGGNFAPLTLGGEPWRLATAMFLHVGLLHLALNMFTLYQAGIVERVLGAGRLLVIYVGAGLLGGVATLIRSSNVVSVGASGAVFGVYGAFGAYLLLRRKTLDPDAMRKTGRGLLTFLGLNLVIGFTQPNIDMAAHLGGLATGFLATVAMLAGARTSKQVGVRSVGVAVLLVGLTVGAVVALKPPADVSGVLAEFERVESTAITAYNAGLTRHKASALTDAEFADLLDRDVLAPWRAVRATLDAAEAPARLARLMAASRAYMRARDDAWSAFATALRAAPADQGAAVSRYETLEAAATAALAEVQRAAKSLR